MHNHEPRLQGMQLDERAGRFRGRRRADRNRGLSQYGREVMTNENG